MQRHRSSCPQLAQWRRKTYPESQCLVWYSILQVILWAYRPVSLCDGRDTGDRCYLHCQSRNRYLWWRKWKDECLNLVSDSYEWWKETDFRDLEVFIVGVWYTSQNLSFYVQRCCASPWFIIATCVKFSFKTWAQDSDVGCVCVVTFVLVSGCSKSTRTWFPTITCQRSSSKSRMGLRVTQWTAQHFTWEDHFESRLLYSGLNLIFWGLGTIPFEGREVCCSVGLAGNSLHVLLFTWQL